MKRQDQSQDQSQKQSEKQSQKHTQKLVFFDLRKRKKFETDKYTIQQRNGKHGLRYFATAKSPYSNSICWRLVARKKLLRSGGKNNDNTV